MPNPSLFLAALRRRKIITRAADSRIFWSARILNAQRDPAAISVGPGTLIRGELFVFAHGGRIEIGRNCYVSEGTRIWSGANVVIGDHVLIAHNVSIMDNLTHPLDHIDRRKQFAAIKSGGHPKEIDLQDRPITIGNDAWICAAAIILRGVTIGERSIVAAGTVVTRDVPPDTIVGGNPAVILRTLDQDATR